MSKLIELTDSDTNKFWVNADNILTLQRDNFRGETKIILGNIIFGVKETIEEIIAMINPH